MSLDHLFNHREILQNTPELDKLSVTLKKGDKGVSIFATKDIAKGDLIAYYKMKVYSNTKKGVKVLTTKDSLEELEKALKKNGQRISKCLSGEKLQHYKKRLVDEINKFEDHVLYLKGKRVNHPKKDMYHFTIYNKHGYEYQTLTGDLYSGSLPKPKNNIPYWGYFSNEPSCKQTHNADVDILSYENYTLKNRVNIKEGETVTYGIVAVKNIKKGEEVMWCYGGEYGRNYPTSCNRKSCKAV
jgi:hypothetical protein